METKEVPADTVMLKANGKGFEALQYRIQVSPLDCTGCGVCAEVCPSKEKSLVMKHLGTQGRIAGGNTTEKFVKDHPWK
jgi:pyruvate-ferredoxin/flavodoxin oxidoreductase